MLEYWVNSEVGVLELDLPQKLDDILIHNDPYNPCDLIYLILKPAKKDLLYWKSKTTLSGPKASLILLINSDVEIYNSDFSTFDKVLVSDNKYHRDGKNFLVVEKDSYKGNIVTFKSCQANSAYFLCKALNWFQGQIKNDLYVELHGQDTSLDLQGVPGKKLTIGNMLLSETIKPDNINLKHLSVKNNLICYANNSLSVDNVSSGEGNTLFQADVIERLSDFSGAGRELIIKATMATLSNFIMPIGKIYIDVNSFLDFKADGKGAFQGVDLYIDLTKNIDEKAIKLPNKPARFDKIFIKGANILQIPGSLVAESIELTDCLKVRFGNSSIGHLKYDVSLPKYGSLNFDASSNGIAAIGSLWSIGYNQIDFYGSAEVFDFDSAGRCNVSVYSNFKCEILKLNLDIDPQTMPLVSNVDGFWGLSVYNDGNKEVKINTILAKSNNFKIKGAVTFGKVICQPIDKYYNLLEVDANHIGRTSIGSFFAGFDHEIVIDKNTGRISLVQSMSRALEGSQIIAGLNCKLNDYLIIRAGSGLSFQGGIEVIDGDIDLFTLFGRLSARGSLTAKNKIQLVALEGEIDLSAELNAKSIVTYAKTGQYVNDSIINADLFLAEVVGNYVQLNSEMSANKIKIVSRNSDVMLLASQLYTNDLELEANKQLRLKDNDLQANSALFSGKEILVDRDNILGNSLFRGSDRIGLVGNNLEGDRIAYHSQDIDIIQSNLRALEIETESRNTQIIGSRLIGSQKHKTDKELLIERSEIMGELIQNSSRDTLKIDSSVIVGNMLLQGAKNNLEVKDSRLSGNYITNVSGGNMKIDSSLVLADQALYFKAVSQYLAVNSDLSLVQYPYQLFTDNFGAIDSLGNPVIRCGIANQGNEILGLVNFGSYGSDELATLQYNVIDSSNIPLEVFNEISRESPKGVFIDAHSGVIMGSSLNATEHRVMIKTVKGIELLPLGVYNAAMFGGGINSSGINYAITKIEAGLISLEGGEIVKLVGALLKSNDGYIKADYLINESNIGEVVARQEVFSKLKPWLNNPRTYDLIINKQVVPSKLEFSEITKIDLGKGKIDILYPYSSKKVLLTQREGDVLLDRDLDVSNYEVMAINAEQGSILFGLPKLEEQVIPRIFKLFGVNTPNKIIETHSTHNNINIKAQTLVLDAGGDVDIHGSFTGNNLDVKAKGKFKISSDTHNFGKTLKQSVVRSDNLYVVADDIEMNGVLFTIKNHLKLVSDNNIRVLPIELLSHYHECSGKTTVKEDALLQVVSRINAGTLNIDAGKVAEFVSTLIEVENLDIKAEDLKISAAKEIFTRQVEFQGAKKWYGGKGAYSMSFDHYETVQPTVINVKNLRIIVDNQATMEAAQIFAEEEILFKTGKGIIIKDGYNIHLHDYHAKQYSLLSFNQGSMKINSNKTFKDFFNKHESVPTIIVAGGHFYGITEGQMHILGSKIIGKDIHIVAPKGLKLEASKYIDTAVNFIHESGFKLGYYNKGNSEVGLSASGFVTSDKLELERHHVNESMLLARDSLSVIVKDGTFEQISSRMHGKIIRVEALNWEAKTYDNKVISNHISQEMETGIKLCAKQNVTQVFDKIKSLVSKKGSHVIDNADRLFKAYDTYKSLAMLPENATSSGLYAYLDGKEVSEYRSSSIAVDNIINGEDIIAKIENDIRFKGVKMTTENIDIEARDFEWQTSDDKHEYQYNLGSVGLEIDLLKKGLGSNLQTSNRNIESETIIHHQNYLKASGNLKLTLSGTGRFIGCSLEGANIDIKANNLILGSVQDTISEKLSGANFHIGYNGDFASNQFGGGFESGFKKSGWSQQLGKIIGSNLVNIVVKDSLELAGGIIANAEEDKYGNLSDKGNLSINCGRMIVKTIHDYDEGVTLGIGASFQLNNTEKGNVASFSHMPLKVEYKDNQRQLFGTIGSGNIISGVIEGDPLNRDISQTEQITKEESFAFDSVIHKEIFGNSKQEPEQVSFKKLYRSLVQEDSVKQKLGNYITDVVGNVKDSGKSFVLGGAKLVNMFGGKIDQERLDEKLHEIIGKDPHTGIDIKERERHLVKIQQEIDKLAETENLDYHKDQDREHAYNKIAYTELFNQLDQQIDKIEDKKTQSLLRATHHILNNEYLKELKAARQENRAIKDVDQFVKEVLTVQLCKPQFANAKEIVWHSLESAKIMLDALVDLTMQGYSGVSAGENYTGSNLKPHDEHEESDESSDDEGWNLTNLAWYDEDGQLLPIDKRPQKPIKQNKVKSFKPITDISPDYTGLSNLLSKFELDEDHEISIMLKAMHKNQSMPIYDSSNKSGVKSNNIGGFSFIDSANASGIGGINTVTSSVITVQDMLLGLGMRGVMSTGVGPLTTMAMNIARLTPTAALAGGIAVGLNNAAQFEHRHPWIGSDFDDIMSNPLVSQEHKDSMWKQMQNDPLLSSNKHKSFMMDIDPNANKPSVESFPIHHQPKSILFTPDDRDKLIQWNQLPGFMPSDFNTKDLLEGFDVHENHWKDSILYKDYEIDHWNVKLASVKDAPEVYQHGKFGKIYKDFEQKVGNKEIWWSKDTANHGGASEGLTPSTYKLFVVRKGEFEWIGDADATGKVIEGKHKSETGKDIKIKDCWKVK